MTLNENDLRLLIRSILQEQEEPEEEEALEVEKEDLTPFEMSTVAKNKAAIFIQVLKSLGLPVRDKHVKASIKSGGEIRVAIDQDVTEPKTEKELLTFVELAFQKILGRDVEVEVLSPNEGRNTSGTYAGYSVEGQPLISFGNSGFGKSQRAGGFEYETRMAEFLKDENIDFKADDNMKTSDIEINGIMIELKKQDADGGSPALVYDFNKSEFYPKRSSSANNYLVDMINSTFDKEETKRKLDIIKNKINLDAATLQSVTMEQFETIVQPFLEKEANQNVSNSKITSEDIAMYYREKGAKFIQIRGKGLYHIDEKNAATLGDGRKTSLFTFPDDVGAAVTFRNYHGARALRPRIKGSAFKKPENSPVSLDNPEDRKLFAAWAEKQNLNESTQNRWELLAGIK